RGRGQHRGGVASARSSERDLGAEQVDPRPTEFAKRVERGDRQQLLGCLERASVALGGSSGERAGPPRGGVVRQLGRLLQERGAGGGAAACLRPRGRALELGRDPLIGACGRLRLVPCSPVWVAL